ncbi:hypothetical protein [Chengkuizengella axinellae]|uniref:Uncharacterized protein n=1 Tax=Chengkuizengella axinellae TaxID=3064388 RepID=A0ABT9IZI6_9BACL|nr:hypothetical protein [Chengkuizengella sp. 2205SS18-9]MDP5274728.1 hypothetical protein [Chengkuizengella sp. 2205SS18-9]
MRTHFKNLKPWKRWTIGIFTFILITLLISVVWIYVDLKSKDIVDIQERLYERDQGQGIEIEKADPDDLPSSVGGQLEKAEEFADKPIEMEDALDVTSILLNSGLSLKEMQYLTGQAKEGLSPEELKHIRDTLLAKLTQEEIDALRQIARYYGRTLDILDPNVKIKGLEEETTEVSQNIEDTSVNQESESTETGIQSIEVQTEPTQENVPTEDGTEEIQQEIVPTLTPVTQEVQQKYQTEIESLQNTCEGKVNDLAVEINSDIDNKLADGEQVTVQYLQATFLQKFVQAENECNNQFEGLMTQAEQEFETGGFDPITIEEWRQTYQNVKDETSNKILNSLISKIQNSGS